MDTNINLVKTPIKHWNICNMFHNNMQDFVVLNVGRHFVGLKSNMHKKKIAIYLRWD